MHAIRAGLAGTDGLATETDLVRGLDLAPLEGFVFGGHEIRKGTLAASAREIHQLNGTIPYPLLDALRDELAAVDRDIRPGTLVNAGATIRALTKPGARVPKQAPKTLRDEVDRMAGDIRRFVAKHRLTRCICVNLSSTEAPLTRKPAHRTTAALDELLDRPIDGRGVVSQVRPSTLYAYVAASLRLPLVHFTPSDGALIPAITELFARHGAPFIGADGKTGETLVKSSLAPMFRYRNLRVLTWQGYNILGDRDGVVLADAANKQAKVATKDALLPQILGYPLHTHVGIDYVPSLHDLKTAWDFVHFRGFLGFKMAMQFIWQGCDAILAAPLVVDLVRFADLAHRRGESGPMTHLACFFKQPFGVDEHDLHTQWRMLTDYVAHAVADDGPKVD